MSASVLAQLTLGYRCLWNGRRLPVAVELHVDAAAARGVDARHLLSTLTELWPARAPRPLLSVRQPALLHDLLLHADAESPVITVPQAALDNHTLRLRVQQAGQRGLPMFWQGGPGQLPPDELASCFQRHMVRLSDAQALQALQTLRTQAHGTSSGPQTGNPPLQGQVLVAPGQPALVDWALDKLDAWAVAGWPMEQMRVPLRQQPATVSREAIDLLLRDIERDASLDRIEEEFMAEPVLAYRLLAHLNATALRPHSPLDSIQRGLMLWGLGPVQNWLRTQRAQAGDAVNLRPVRQQVVTRAQLLVQLLEPGDEEELRRELWLCGLLSQLDLLLGEPLPVVLERLPLSQRILQSLLEQGGPYQSGLELARRLESPDTQATRRFCEERGYAAEDVNRALLHTLASLGS